MRSDIVLAVLPTGKVSETDGTIYKLPALRTVALLGKLQRSRLSTHLDLAGWGWEYGFDDDSVVYLHCLDLADGMVALPCTISSAADLSAGRGVDSYETPGSQRRGLASTEGKGSVGCHAQKAFDQKKYRACPQGLATG